MHFFFLNRLHASCHTSLPPIIAERSNALSAKSVATTQAPFLIRNMLSDFCSPLAFSVHSVSKQIVLFISFQSISTIWFLEWLLNAIKEKKEKLGKQRKSSSHQLRKRGHLRRKACSPEKKKAVSEDQEPPEGNRQTSHDIACRHEPADMKAISKGSLQDVWSIWMPALIHKKPIDCPQIACSFCALCAQTDNN